MCIQISHKSQLNIPDTELTELLFQAPQGDLQQLRNDIIRMLIVNSIFINGIIYLQTKICYITFFSIQHI